MIKKRIKSIIPMLLFLWACAAFFYMGFSEVRAASDKIVGVRIPDEYNTEANRTFYRYWNDRRPVKPGVEIEVTYANGSTRLYSSEYGFGSYPNTVSDGTQISAWINEKNEVIAKVETEAQEFETKLYDAVIKDASELPHLVDKIEFKSSETLGTDDHYDEKNYRWFYYETKDDCITEFTLTTKNGETFDYYAGIYGFCEDEENYGDLSGIRGDNVTIANINDFLGRGSVYSNGEKILITVSVAPANLDCILSVKTTPIDEYVKNIDLTFSVSGEYLPQFEYYNAKVDIPDSSEDVRLYQGNSSNHCDVHTKDWNGTIYYRGEDCPANTDPNDNSPCLTVYGKIVSRGSGELKTIKYISRAEDTENLYDTHIEDLDSYVSGTEVSVPGHSYKVMKYRDKSAYDIEISGEDGEGADSAYVLRLKQNSGDDAERGYSGSTYSGSVNQESYILFFYNDSDETVNYKLKKVETQGNEKGVIGVSVGYLTYEFFKGFNDDCYTPSNMSLDLTYSNGTTESFKFPKSLKKDSGNILYCGDKQLELVEKESCGSISISCTVDDRSFFLYYIEIRDLDNIGKIGIGKDLKLSEYDETEQFRLIKSPTPGARLKINGIKDALITLYDSHGNILYEGKDGEDISFVVEDGIDYVIGVKASVVGESVEGTLRVDELTGNNEVVGVNATATVINYGAYAIQDTKVALSVKDWSTGKIEEQYYNIANELLVNGSADYSIPSGKLLIRTDASGAQTVEYSGDLGEASGSVNIAPVSAIDLNGDTANITLSDATDIKAIGFSSDKVEKIVAQYPVDFTVYNTKSGITKRYSSLTEISGFDASTDYIVLLGNTSGYSQVVEIVKKKVAEPTVEPISEPTTTPTPDPGAGDPTLIQDRIPTINVKTSIEKSLGDKAFNLNVKTDSAGKLSYKTANKKVATVSSTGKVTLKGVGTTKITVSVASILKVDSKTNIINYKEASKTVTITVLPRKVTKTTVATKSSGLMMCTWKKASGIDGYEVQIDLEGKKRFKKKNKDYKAKNFGAKVTSFKLAGFKKGKKYHIRIRTFKKVGKKKYYSNWSKITAFKIK